jgi:hypothetical protein
MIDSVRRNSSLTIKWEILALDDSIYAYLIGLNDQSFNVMSFADLDDPELNSLFGKRPWNEICWTSTACLLSDVLSRTFDNRIVGYIDADCFFYGEISHFFSDLDSGHEIFIHEHRFSKDRQDWLFKSGRFNVGLLGGMNGGTFRQCISKWRKQVLADCSVDQRLGKCGDQTYLNDWPDLYPSLKVVDYIGAGVAPWNLNNYRLGQNDNVPTVDGSEVLFYHFHGLKFVFFSKFLSIYCPAPGYNLISNYDSLIYKKYIKSLLYTRRSMKLFEFRSRRMPILWSLRHLFWLRLEFSFRFPLTESRSYEK